jgi:hypothetical protein
MNKVYLLAFLSALLFFGTAPSAKKETHRPAVVNALELRDLIAFNLDWLSVRLTEVPEDSVYLVPGQEDIDSLIKMFKRRREWNSYVAEQWDCDDIAREFLHYSRVWNRYNYPNVRAAITVGAAYVRLEGDRSEMFPTNKGQQRPAFHVTNVILRSDGQWFFYEPQTDRLFPVEGMLFEGTIEILRVQL